jgi:hypothetical protein
MIHNLFPTPVAIYKLERDLTAKELSFIKGQETRPNMGNTTSEQHASPQQGDDQTAGLYRNQGCGIL